MGKMVKETISLPSELAREAGKTLSAVIQDALRLARKERMKKELKDMQGYWSRKAKEKACSLKKIFISTL